VPQYRDFARLRYLFSPSAARGYAREVDFKNVALALALLRWSVSVSLSASCTPISGLVVVASP
jgi:hypothetical protein